MSSPPPPDQAASDQAGPDPASTPQASQRGRSRFDYALVICTSVLFLAYFPIFSGVPRMLQHHLTELDLMWFLPLVLISSCMLVLWSWVLLGVTVVGRLAWIVLLVLSGLAYPVGMVGLLGLWGFGP